MIAWTIVIIVVVVAIVSHLASTKAPPPKAARPAEENNPMAKSRPTSSEIDRFLEEVNRRKQQQQEKRLPPPPVQREPQRPRQVIIEQRPPVVAKPVPSSRPVYLAEPVVPAVIIAEPVETPARSLMTLNQLANIQVPATLTQKVDSPAIKQAKSLMKTREGMRSVFILSEILGPPRCRRPYRRSGP